MRRWKGVVTAAVLVALVAGCASQSTPTTGPQGSAAANSAPGLPDPNALVSTGPLDPAVVAAMRAVTLPTGDALGQAAADLGAGLQARINAQALFGTSATALETGFDKAESDALSQLTDKVKAKLQPAGLAPVARGHLASYRLPVAPAAAPENTAMLGVAWLFVTILGGFAVGAFNPQAGDIPPTSFTQTLDQPGSNGADLNVSVTLTFSSSAGVVTGTLNLDGTGSATDATTNQPTSLKGSTSYSFSINPCPDPAGHVSGTVALGDDESLSGGGKTVGYQIKGTTDYTTSVDDQAQIAQTDTKAQWDETVTTTDGKDTDTYGLGLSDTDSFGATGGAVAGAAGGTTVDSQTGTVTDAQALEIAKAMQLFGVLTPQLLSQQAAEVWKGGKCFQVRPSPNGGDVGPGSATKVEVSVYHWVDKADIQVPVTATLSGSKQIDPSGTPVQSKATFTFTAGQPASTGDVAFKSTSKRGIGSTTASFKVQAGLLVDIAGTYKEDFFPISYRLTVSAHGINVVANPDGSLSASGNAKVKGTVTALNGLCRGTINESIPVQGQGMLQGPDDAQVFHVLIGPASTNQLGQVLRCPQITVPSNQGDFFGQWSTTIGAVDLPAAGGVVTKSGSTASPPRQASGTYTATTK